MKGPDQERKSEGGGESAENREFLIQAIQSMMNLVDANRKIGRIERDIDKYEMMLLVLDLSGSGGGGKAQEHKRFFQDQVEKSRRELQKTLEEARGARRDLDQVRMLAEGRTLGEIDKVFAEKDRRYENALRKIRREMGLE